MSRFLLRTAASSVFAGMTSSPFVEPGEAVGLNCGVLVATVLDIVPGDPETAILDTSAAAHMPDVLEMPYRPEVHGAAPSGEKAHTYRLGGVTCLADVDFDTRTKKRAATIGQVTEVLLKGHCNDCR